MSFIIAVPIFTKDPNELRGEIIRCQFLVPADGYLGMSMAPQHRGEELPQIEAIAPDGAAGQEGTLQSGE